MRWVKPDVVAFGLRLPICAGCAHFGRKAVLKGANMSNKTSISGLSDEEAQEFHHYWMQGAVGFTAVAVLAHILVWAWRPWF
jgi:light-harvesting complex 1 beta chain